MFSLHSNGIAAPRLSGARNDKINHLNNNTKINPMKLIIGLGNPGKDYAKTRHNVGFMAIERLAENFSAQGGSAAGGKFSAWNFDTKFNAEISEGLLNNEKIILAKPQTFMNESGASVKAIIDYYKIGIENITVIHDDLDIRLGEYKIAQNRSSAGHKGVQSIIDALGTKNFKRIRIGIGIEDKKIPTEDFVLQNFKKEETKIMLNIIEKISIEILAKK